MDAKNAIHEACNNDYFKDTETTTTKKNTKKNLHLESKKEICNFWDTY